MNIKKKIKIIYKKYILFSLNRYKILRLIAKVRPKKTDIRLIRLGNEMDGGYLIPDDLVGITDCFSAGVGNVCDFEYDCAQKGMDVYLADASVESPPSEHPRFKFLKNFIGNKNFEEYITLEEWIANSKIAPSNHMLLQMDIEGDEYQVLNSVSIDTLKKFRIIVIEFHHLQLLSEKTFYKNANTAFKKILKNHICVHIHPNNCCGTKFINNIEIPLVAEFTFFRKDRIKNFSSADKFPHELDRDNVDNASFELPEIWYKK